MARIALIVLSICAGCQTPRVVRVEARYSSLVPLVTAAISLSVER